MIAAITVIFTALTMLSVPIAMGTGVAVAAGLAFFSSFPIGIMFQKMVTGIDNFVLAAIPLYILTGNLMNAGGITDRIFTFVRRLVGHVPGGLAHANVGASLIFAGMSGSAVADAGGLGAIEIKAMRDQGYKVEFAAAVSAASSTIGPIIPPSIPFILYGAIAEVSVGQLFVAGIIPGLILAFSQNAMIMLMDRWQHFPRDVRATMAEVFESFASALFALLTPVIILSGLLMGIFTPTEAGGVAVAYALVLTLFVYKTITVRDLPKVIVEAMITTAVVTFIISTVSALSWVLVVNRAGDAFVASVRAFTDDPVLVLLLINLALLVLGAIMEAGAVLILMTPILLPLAVSVGVDPVHFGVIIVLNLMIGVATPPIGMSLFVTAHVAQIPVERLMRAIMPMIVPLLVTLLVITYWPSLSLWLPRLAFQ